MDHRGIPYLPQGTQVRVWVISEDEDRVFDGEIRSHEVDALGYVRYMVAEGTRTYRVSAAGIQHADGFPTMNWTVWTDPFDEDDGWVF